jgi:hypothetical protein
MYKISNQTNEQYGKVVVIERTEDLGIETPFFAMEAAKKNCRLWREQGANNVRFLVDGQVLTPKQLETWAREENKLIPRCAWCAKFLQGEVFRHGLCGTSLFCTQSCADKDYQERIEKQMDEEEIEYL